MPWVLLCAAVVATLPLRLFLRADINREPTFEIVIYLYGFRMQFEGLLERDASLSVRRGGGKNGVRLPLRALGRFFLRLLEVSSPGTSTAICENQLSFLAPCQCFTSGGMVMTVPGSRLTGALPSS